MVALVQYFYFFGSTNHDIEIAQFSLPSARKELFLNIQEKPQRQMITFFRITVFECSGYFFVKKIPSTPL